MFCGPSVCLSVCLCAVSQVGNTHIISLQKSLMDVNFAFKPTKAAVGGGKFSDWWKS